jgi:hypothetical protein
MQNHSERIVCPENTSRKVMTLLFTWRSVSSEKRVILIGLGPACYSKDTLGG